MTSTDTFSSFSEQLADILKNCGLEKEEDDTNSCVAFLLDRYQKASVPITKTTLLEQPASSDTFRGTDLIPSEHQYVFILTEKPPPAICRHFNYDHKKKGDCSVLTAPSTSAYCIITEHHNL